MPDFDALPIRQKIGSCIEKPEGLYIQDPARQKIHFHPYSKDENFVKPWLPDGSLMFDPELKLCNVGGWGRVEVLAEDAELWCSCRRPDFGGLMIKCSIDKFDGYECVTEWFHLQCVGLKKEPPESEDWYCARCVKWYTYPNGPVGAPNEDESAKQDNNKKRKRMPLYQQRRRSLRQLGVSGDDAAFVREGETEPVVLEELMKPVKKVSKKVEEAGEEKAKGKDKAKAKAK